MVSLINKTKRIGDRSDTNCDTHTQSHTDRQSTLDKYMIDFLSLIGQGLLCHIRIIIGFLGEHPKIFAEDGGDRHAPCRGANGTGFG